MTALPAFLEEHLNVYWLRPEAALWDSVASTAISREPWRSPSLDLGSGNGIFSFITAGGAFTLDYDWYRNADPGGFRENRDIYDCFVQGPRPGWIARRPSIPVDTALDAKPNLLRQAEALGFYHRTVTADANLPLPFSEESFQTIFSNILYWLDSFETSLREIRRILRPGGRALLCLPHPRFREICESYQWREKSSELLRLLNRGRDESSRWSVTEKDVEDRARTAGLRIVSLTRYLSPTTLRFWDVGLRPLIAVLIRMTGMLSEDDRRRIKEDWMETARPLLCELFDLDRKGKNEGGYLFAVLEKP